MGKPLNGEMATAPHQPLSRPSLPPNHPGSESLPPVPVANSEPHSSSSPHFRSSNAAGTHPHSSKFRISIPAVHSMSSIHSSKPSHLMVEARLVFNGVEVEERFLVDTGATGVYIHIDVAKRLYGDQFPSPDTETATCVVANAVEEEIFRAPTSSFSVSGRSLSLRPSVMRTLSYQGILGYNALRAMGFMIDTVNHRLLVCADAPIEECLEDSEEIGLSAVETVTLGTLAISDARTVPRRSAMLVPALLSDNSKVNEFCLIEQAREGALPAGVLIMTGLATMVNSHVPVLLVNTTEDDILIHRFTRIASAVRLDHRPSPSLASISSSRVSWPPMSKQDFLAQFDLPEDLSRKEKEQLKSFLWQEKDTFSRSDFDIGCFKGFKHTIDTGNERPYRETLRRHNPKTREEIKALVDEMLHHGIIQPSFSPWSSAPVLVQKKSGGKRFAVDFRGLNSRTIKDSFPLPQIADALDCFAGSSRFSCLDLTQGFWQIELDESSRAKTAFSTPQGFYEFRRLAFGLCNAPSSFSRAMACCLEGLNWEIALCFLDDIIVFSRTFEEHLTRLRKVLSRLREYNLKLKPKKCKFLQSSVSYLGHVVSAEGISADPKKIDSIQNWTRPSTATQVRSFLGLAQYYRRFVKNFSSVAAPLFECYKAGDRKITWGDAQESAFLQIKECLSSPPVMCHPDFDRDFIVDTDASSVGIGCVLSQMVDGRERVIAYQSHKFSRAEKKWSTTDREFFALIMACRLFKSYLYGRRFTLRTDHQALIGLLNKAKEMTGKLARWWCELSLYNYSLVYRPGTAHGNADGLSRQPQFEEEGDNPAEINCLSDAPAEPVDIIQLQRNDPITSCIISSILGRAVEAPDGSVLADDDYWKHFKRHRGRYSIKGEILLMDKYAVMPRSGLPSLLYVLHDSPLSGHLGKNRTLRVVKERFWWPGWSGDVACYVRSCIPCQIRKGDANKTVAPLHPSTPMDHPWQRLAMDVLCLPPSHGYSYVLVIVDYFSKWVEAFPIRDKSAVTICNILLNEIFWRYGPPTFLHSDRGKEFVASIVHQLTSLSSVYQTHTPAYAPRGDGQAERQIRTLNDMLSKYATDKGQWFPYLGPCLSAVRSTVSETTGFSPFEVLFGRKPRLIADLNYGLPARPPQKYPNSYNEMQARMREVHSDVKQAQARVALRMKEAYDSRRKVGLGRFSPGQWVWVQVRPGPRLKLLPKWEGPFLVSRINDVSSIYVSRSGRVVKTPNDRCKLFMERPFHLQSREYRDALARSRIDFTQDPPALVLGSSLRTDSLIADSSTPSVMPPSLFQSSPPAQSPALPIPTPIPPVPTPAAPAQQEQAVEVPGSSEPIVSPAEEPIPSEAVAPVPVSSQLRQQPVVLLDRLSPETIRRYTGGDSSSPPAPDPPLNPSPVPEASLPQAIPPDPASEQSPVDVPPAPPPVDVSPVLPPVTVPAAPVVAAPDSDVRRVSSRPRAPPRSRLTYDENFQQVSALSRFRSWSFWLNSPCPFFALGLLVVDTSLGPQVVYIFPNSVVDKYRFCQVGDIVNSVDGRPVRTAHDYAKSTLVPGVRTVTVARREV